eukprot:scaffold8546_cov21-Tisochrysis_lutea.AAC.2
MPVMTCGEMAQAAFAIAKLARIERATLTAAAPPAAPHESTPASHTSSTPARQRTMTLLSQTGPTPGRSTRPADPLPATATATPAPSTTTTNTNVSASFAAATSSSSSSPLTPMNAAGTSAAQPAIDDALLARFLAVLEASFEVQSATARRGDAHLCSVAA